jgi:hypothetical protein
LLITLKTCYIEKTLKRHFDKEADYFNEHFERNGRRFAHSIGKTTNHAGATAAIRGSIR